MTCILVFSKCCVVRFYPFTPFSLIFFIGLSVLFCVCFSCVFLLFNEVSFNSGLFSSLTLNWCLVEENLFVILPLGREWLIVFIQSHCLFLSYQSLLHFSPSFPPVLMHFFLESLALSITTFTVLDPFFHPSYFISFYHFIWFLDPPQISNQSR